MQHEGLETEDLQKDRERCIGIVCAEISGFKSDLWLGHSRTFTWGSGSGVPSGHLCSIKLPHLHSTARPAGPGGAVREAVVQAMRGARCPPPSTLQNRDNLGFTRPENLIFHSLVAISMLFFFPTPEASRCSVIVPRQFSLADENVIATGVHMIDIYIQSRFIRIL